jgi:hypothetical protein
MGFVSRRDQSGSSRVAFAARHPVQRACLPGSLILSTMPTTPEEAGTTETKGMLGGLFDLSFRTYATPRMLKFLYALHLLAGLIAAVAYVVLSFQQAPVQGLIALIASLVLYCVWILYCRVALEVLSAVFRMAEAIAPHRSSHE